jgi:hypothetical protein
MKPTKEAFLDQIKGNTNKEVAAYFGIGVTKVKELKRLYGAIQKPQLESDIAETTELQESNEFAGDKWIHESVTDKDIHTLEDLIAYCKVNTEDWYVERWKVGKHQGFIKNANKEVETTPMLWSIKATFVRNKNVKQAKQIISVLFEEMKKHSQVVPKFTYPTLSKKENGLLLEIAPFDIHFNSLCWAGDAGEDYDSKIAQERYDAAINDLIARATAAHKISRILLPIGNDLFNADSNLNMTTKGTPQITDSRHQKVFRKVFDMKISSINKMSSIAPVDVIVVPGNHDQETCFYLGMCLEVYYHNNPNVTVDNSSMLRKYYEYGQNMLMFTHGDKEKLTELANIMAVEKPEIWARTKYREAHTGHRHQTRSYGAIDVDEKYGVRTRILPSLCGTNRWHYENGYVGNLRACEAFIWDFRRGLISTLIYTLDQN